MQVVDPFWAPAGELPVWLDWIERPLVLSGLAVGLTLLGLVSLLGLPLLLTRIPADYFSRPRGPSKPGSARWLGRIAKNVAGGLLLLLGIAMLVLPGQGILTILVALVLLDLPGKRRFERWLVQRPRVFEMLNLLRTRTGHPPLEQAAPDGGQAPDPARKRP